MNKIEVLRETNGTLTYKRKTLFGSSLMNILPDEKPALLAALLEDSPAAIKMHIDEDGHCIVDDERFQQGVAGKTGTCWLVGHGSLPIQKEGGE